MDREVLRPHRLLLTSHLFTELQELNVGAREIKKASKLKIPII
jgi:hypothetical protein